MPSKKIYPPIFIAGPTASGKSSLAISLARLFDSVIISADSMQIYRGLDIGTAKECQKTRQKIEHKMIDIVDAKDEFSVAEYAEMAKAEIKNAQEQGKLPIIVGGTGLYFEALLYPMSFASVIKNQSLRDELSAELEEYGAEYMHQKLANLDVETSKRIHKNDTKRVIRALEIIITSKKTLKENSDDIQKENPDVIMIALNTERAKLYERINERVDVMFAQGLVNEVYSVGDFSYQSMQAIGYKEFSSFEPIKLADGSYTLNECDLTAIKDLIKQHTRNYAKRQLTWFRKYDFIKWFDVFDTQSAIKYLVDEINKKNTIT